MEKAHCVDTDKLHNAFAISDVVTDFVIISLPVPMVCLLFVLCPLYAPDCEPMEGRSEK